jgi:ABC-type antimicrobial peptide transport system permease subunit
MFGTAGMAAYGVARRRREWAVRLALGAEPSGIVGHVLIRVLRVAAIGAAAGLAIGVGTGAALRAVLFGTAPTEPLVVLVALGGVLLAVGVAAYLPARRAGRADPSSLLRIE